MKKAFYLHAYLLLGFTVSTIAQDQEKKQDQLETKEHVLYLNSGQASKVNLR